ncbi:MAG TPA: HypC/HybG/HupF family hydrogenase formation chaperone [Rhodobacteraceae bacterium]|nr:HypC/HybG/HupF family hydrogenase formation chaperone [Paracoccaceae bacterium]
MCLALPAKIVEMTSGDNAIVSLEGVKKEISLALVPDAKIGDYVLVHVGYALNTISSEEAEETLRLMAEMSMIGTDTGTYEAAQ